MVPDCRHPPGFGGNPLFGEELCHSAAIRGIERPSEKQFGGSAWLESLIESRVGRLGRADVELVRKASVIGNVFPRWLLAEISGTRVDDELVHALASQDFIHPSDQHDMLRFKYGVTRDVVYDRARQQYAATLEALDKVFKPDRAYLLRWCMVARKLGMACVFDALALTDAEKLLKRGVEWLASQKIRPPSHAPILAGHIYFAKGRDREALAHCPQAAAAAAARQYPAKDRVRVMGDLRWRAFARSGRPMLVLAGWRRSALAHRIRHRSGRRRAGRSRTSGCRLTTHAHTQERPPLTRPCRDAEPRSWLCSDLPRALPTCRFVVPRPPFPSAWRSHWPHAAAGVTVPLTAPVTLATKAAVPWRLRRLPMPRALPVPR